MSVYTSLLEKKVYPFCLDVYKFRLKWKKKKWKQDPVRAVRVLRSCPSINLSEPDLRLPDN